MNKKTLIRIGVFLFLFAVGYLVGGGIGKTIKYLTGKASVTSSASVAGLLTTNI